MTRLTGHLDILSSGDLGLIAVLDRAKPQTINEDSTLLGSLKTLAAETDRTLLCVIEAVTLLAMVTIVFLMTHVHDSRAFLAAGLMLAYFTAAAVTGGYLIMIKNKPAEDR